MEDLLPADAEKWQWLEEQVRTYFPARGYSEIRTPILEATELFARSIGEATGSSPTLRSCHTLPRRIACPCLLRW